MQTHVEITRRFEMFLSVGWPCVCGAGGLLRCEFVVAHAQLQLMCGCVDFVRGHIQLKALCGLFMCTQQGRDPIRDTNSGIHQKLRVSETPTRVTFTQRTCFMSDHSVLRIIATCAASTPVRSLFSQGAGEPCLMPCLGKSVYHGVQAT